MWAWGHKTHSQIVEAGLSALPAEDRLVARLGEDARRLPTYALLGDWRDSFISIEENWNSGHEQVPQALAQFYSNDYLIFPLAPRQFEHEMPDVSNAYQPFFLRALQALRTESPSNAARWIGSLLHFVTDSGSPPHAAGIRGEVHSKMEGWVDASQIQMSGYKPQLLGKTDQEALAGFLGRMHELIEFSRRRAERLLPLIKANDQPTLNRSPWSLPQKRPGWLPTCFTLCWISPRQDPVPTVQSFTARSPRPTCRAWRRSPRS